MAEIADQRTQRSQSKRKIHSIKVDLTPMVDLGFLLITFFVITTSMKEPKAADLLMPKDSPDSSAVPGSAALTVVMRKDNMIDYFSGSLDTAAVLTTGFMGIRNVIIAKQKALRESSKANELVLIIQSDSASTYKNLIDMLDEVMINDIRHYYISEITPEEETMIARKH